DTEHHERVVEPTDAATALQHLLWNFGEPFSDHSFLPTYYLAAETRQSVTVALSGDGADETFAGYRRYSRVLRRERVRRFIPDRLLRYSTKYGYDPVETMTGIFTMGLTSSEVGDHARGPLAAAARHYDPREVIGRLVREAPPERVGLLNTL